MTVTEAVQLRTRREFSADAIAAACARGDLLAGDGKPVSPTDNFSAIDRYRDGLWLYRPVADETETIPPIRIIASSPHWVIVDKPAGIATMPRGSYVARSLVVALRRQLGNNDIVPAHRLDRATNGLVLMITDPTVRGHYQTLFQNSHTPATNPTRPQLRAGHIYKEYMATARTLTLNDDSQFPTADSGVSISQNIPREGLLRISGRIAKLPGETFVHLGDPRGKEAISLVDIAGGTRPRQKTLAEDARFTTYRLWPLTGRTHQLRVHLAALGAPIVGDPLYGGDFAAEYGSDHQSVSTPQTRFGQLDSPETTTENTRPDGSDFSSQLELPLQLVCATLGFVDPVTGEHVLANSDFRL